MIAALIMGGYKLALAILGMLLGYAGLHFLDTKTDWLHGFRASTNHQGFGIYLGLRFVGMCLLVGLALS